MECPICNAEIKLKSYSDEVWGAYINVENDTSCPRCDYTDFDSYGSYQISFGNNLWRWHHNTPSFELEEIEKEIELAIKIAKPSFKHRKYRYFYCQEDIPF